MKDRIYLIVGPTATGKTRVGIELAKRVGGEVISADSMQIYKGMIIGTAAPRPWETEGIPHHMIGIVEPDKAFSVAAYQKMAFSIVEDIFSRGKVPVFVGGTGLYVNSITHRLDFTVTEADQELREYYEKAYDSDREAVYGELIKLDPGSAERIHLNDKKRVIRRLEVIKNGGSADYDFDRTNDDYDFASVCLFKPREIIYADIEKRVDGMFSEGLEDEARGIYEKYGGGITAFLAIGYKEFIPYFEGRCTVEEVKSEIKKNTRRFAKRQITWFKRDPRIKWCDVTGFEGPSETAEYILTGME